MQTSDHSQVKGFKALQRLGEEALTNDKLRRELIFDPKKVLKRRGVTVAANVEVVVHQNTASLIHLVLPAAPRANDLLDTNEAGLKILMNKHPF